VRENIRGFLGSKNLGFVFLLQWGILKALSRLSYPEINLIYS
jgi:hypothetical protein